MTNTIPAAGATVRDGRDDILFEPVQLLMLSSSYRHPYLHGWAGSRLGMSVEE